MHKYNITECYYQDKFLIIIFKYHHRQYVYCFVSMDIQAILLVTLMLQILCTIFFKASQAETVDSIWEIQNNSSLIFALGAREIT